MIFKKKHSSKNGHKQLCLNKFLLTSLPTYRGAQNVRVYESIIFTVYTHAAAPRVAVDALTHKNLFPSYLSKNKKVSSSSKVLFFSLRRQLKTRKLILSHVRSTEKALVFLC